MKSLKSMQGYVKGLYLSKLVETPSPVSPSPSIRGRGINRKRGSAPLRHHVMEERDELPPLKKGGIEGDLCYATTGTSNSFPGNSERI